jgi:tetratricopeptide (TPR) repeat protein
MPLSWQKTILRPAIVGLWLIGLLAMPSLPAICLAQQPAGDEKSWPSSITSGIKSGFSKLGGSGSSGNITPAQAPKDDPVSLQSKAKVGPELHVAVARWYVETGNFAEAEQHYRQALKMKADYLPALLGYADLKDVIGQPGEALKFYQLAIKTAPKNAAPYNNLGLWHARHRRTDDAISSIAKAVELAPQNPLYRNNIATLLVERGQYREAFNHLRAVHGEAAAYYNMGYLLNKKGRTDDALKHFAAALRVDPSMVQARQWIEHLQQSQQSVARTPVRLAERGVDPRWQREAPPPAATADLPPAPRRLPPTGDDEPVPGVPQSLPGISEEPPDAPTAPMPPPISNSAVRPLPRVR